MIRHLIVLGSFNIHLYFFVVMRNTKFCGFISSCLIVSALYIGAAKLVVAVAVFLLTFYVISQVFEIKMDASLGNLFGKFLFFSPLNFICDEIVFKFL